MRGTWGDLIVDQLDFYWNVYLRPRLDGLTDEEYFWEPVDGCWSLRQGPDGQFHLEQTRPDPTPSPVTTIAWRIVHLGATCLANRASTFFGDGTVPEDAPMFDPRHIPTDLPGTADAALAFLDHSYHAWFDNIAALTEPAFLHPLGPKGAYFANDPMAGLILHINREVMHHGGEILLLRDLYRTTGATNRASRLVPNR